MTTKAPLCESYRTTPEDIKRYHPMPHPPCSTCKNSYLTHNGTIPVYISKPFGTETVGKTYPMLGFNKVKNKKIGRVPTNGW